MRWLSSRPCSSTHDARPLAVLGVGQERPSWRTPAASRERSSAVMAHVDRLRCRALRPMMTHRWRLRRPFAILPGCPRSAVLLRVASDERLVEHVRDGSDMAFEVIYDRHHRGILGFCRHMLGSAEEAEDALQHTFMAAYRDLLRSDKPIQLRPWLYAIARNRCFTILSARRERRSTTPTSRRPSTSRRRGPAPPGPARPARRRLRACPTSSAPRSCSRSSAPSPTRRSPSCSTCRGRRSRRSCSRPARSLIASRTARETPCADIREQLAILRGGALRRTTLRRHLRECPGCRAFRGEVAAQRRALAVALPVEPTVGLKDTALWPASAPASGGCPRPRGGGGGRVRPASSTAGPGDPAGCVPADRAGARSPAARQGNRQRHRGGARDGSTADVRAATHAQRRRARRP